MAGFLTPLDLRFLDGRFWELTEPLEYALGAPDGPEAVHVPAGFITDLASIPRVLWSLWPPAGPYGKPAVLHDWLYRYCMLTSGRLVTRAEADKILFEAMAVVGVSWLTRHVIYGGVRIGGCGRWGRYRREASHQR